MFKLFFAFICRNAEKRIKLLCEYISCSVEGNTKY